MSDAAGNAAPEVVRTVTVTAGTDTEAPIITLIGEREIAISVGSTYTDEGATATDNVDGNLTSSINVNNPVDTNTAGMYEITYNVSDAAGNAAKEVNRFVTVK